MIAWKIIAANRGCHHLNYFIPVAVDYKNRWWNVRSVLCLENVLLRDILNVKYHVLDLKCNNLYSNCLSVKLCLSSYLIYEI